MVPFLLATALALGAGPVPAVGDAAAGPGRDCRESPVRGDGEPLDLRVCHYLTVNVPAETTLTANLTEAGTYRVRVNDVPAGEVEVRERCPGLLDDWRVSTPEPRAVVVDWIRGGPLHRRSRRVRRGLGEFPTPRRARRGVGSPKFDLPGHVASWDRRNWGTW